jgi:hypothetical protein
MNAAYITQNLSHQHQAELLREADRARLARLARSGGEVEFGGPVSPNRGIRIALAIGGAAAAILATGSVVLAAVAH